MSNIIRGKRCEYDGFKFDSEQERDYYVVLKELKSNKKIKNFAMQVPCSLMDEFVDFRGNKVQKMDYVADYVVTLLNGEEIYLDVKGSKSTTEESARIKQKIFMSKYPERKIYFIAKTSNYLGNKWVEVSKGYDFESKLKNKYKNLYGRWRRNATPNWVTSDWEEHFDFEDFCGLFYIWKSTKSLKKGGKNGKKDI